MVLHAEVRRTFLMVGSVAVGQLALDLTKLGWKPGVGTQTTQWVRLPNSDASLRLSLTPTWYSFNRSHLAGLRVTVESCSVLARGFQTLGAKVEPLLRLTLGGTSLQAPVPLQAGAMDLLDYDFSVFPNTDLQLRLRLMDNWTLTDLIGRRDDP
eukprot:TRINITY_DN3958_c0_g1_i1.p1 TRINITY_DN3958_c0_g1~~TRINITY_DN3958_c0_g1_i1.p1  ORF type:complete len:172 (+),score=25.57 TRINITY_DN3958_c0_g1_i1:56-517(+)